MRNLLLAVFAVSVTACLPIEAPDNQDKEPSVKEPVPINTNANAVPPAQDTKPALSGDQLLLAEALQKQFPSHPVENFEVNVLERVDDRLVGNFTFCDGPGCGGVFFAAKINGQWVIVESGNGLPDCEPLERYAIPSAIMDKCVDEDGELIQRGKVI